MIRARFLVPDEDYRPVVWPISHPYWCTGFSDAGNIIVAYADDEAQLLQWWPDAQNIDAEECSGYTFTSRFQKPDWFQEAQS